MQKVIEQYRRSFRLAYKAIRSNLIIIPATWVGLLVFQYVIAAIGGGAGMAGGMLVSLIASAMMSFLYLWLETATSGRKVTKHTLFTWDQEYFSLVMNAGFWIWVLNLPFASMLPSGGGNGMAMGAVAAKFLVCILFNCLAEIIIIHKSGQFLVFRESISFVQRHFVVWFLPVVLLHLVGFLMGENFLYSFLGTRVLLPVMDGVYLVSEILLSFLYWVPGITFVSSFVGVALGVFWSLFRLELFRQLDR